MTRLLPTAETVYGKDGLYETPYLTRVAWGPFFVHVFHRGDNDPDPHDHRRAFWTFPLTSYVEAVVEPAPDQPNAYLVKRVVRAFRLYRREATHTHRVCGRWSGERTARDLLPVWVPGRIVTVGMWDRRKPPRAWGFWRPKWNGSPREARFVFVPWRRYVFGKES